MAMYAAPSSVHLETVSIFSSFTPSFMFLFLFYSLTTCLYLKKMENKMATTKA